MSRRYAFGRFEVRPDERRVLEAGEPIALGSRAFDLLLALIDRRDRVVGKDELLALVWPGKVVEENNLTVQVSTLRKLLGTEAISTAPGRGYRFTLAPNEGETKSSASPATDAGFAMPLPDRPSIAVLPFANLSGDPAQEYFTDGLTEDIITDLSRFGAIFVIARNTSFTFKGRNVDVTVVARELGVHFVLEGSVRKEGQRVRVTAQLIDGLTGHHVWAERYEDVVDDVFDLQERITRQIVGSLVPEIVEEEMRLLDRGQRRFTEAHDLSWRAVKTMLDAVANGNAVPAVEAISLARSAIDVDRRCTAAWHALCACLGWQVFMGWADDRRGALAAAGRATDALMVLAPGDSRSFYARGMVNLLGGSFDRGLADLRRAVELNPRDALAMFMLCWNEAAAGNVERARELAAQALRLSPKDRFMGNAHLAYAMAAFVDGDFDALRHWAELAIQSSPTAPIRRVLMIVYAAEAGDAALMKTHVDRLSGIAPDFIPSLFRGDYHPFHRREHMEILLDKLRKAGLERAGG